jgi:hypothetical protein
MEEAENLVLLKHIQRSWVITRSQMLTRRRKRKPAAKERRTTMKFRNLMLAVFGLAILAGSAVPANAAYHHHHRHHHHRHG